MTFPSFRTLISLKRPTQIKNRSFLHFFAALSKKGWPYMHICKQKAIVADVALFYALTCRIWPLWSGTIMRDALAIIIRLFFFFLQKSARFNKSKRHWMRESSGLAKMAKGQFVKDDVYKGELLKLNDVHMKEANSTIQCHTLCAHVRVMNTPLHPTFI